MNKTDYADNTIPCCYNVDLERPCRFRVHESCWRVHCDIRESTTEGFECRNVVYQLKRQTVTELDKGEHFEGREQLIKIWRN